MERREAKEACTSVLASISSDRGRNGIEGRIERERERARRRLPEEKVRGQEMMLKETRRMKEGLNASGGGTRRKQGEAEAWRVVRYAYYVRGTRTGGSG